MSQYSSHILPSHPYIGSVCILASSVGIRVAKMLVDSKIPNGLCVDSV